MKRALLASALVAVHCFSAHAQVAVERPPQFVLMAFDNCTELERWQEWSEFAGAHEPRQRPRPLHILRQRRELHRQRQPRRLRGTAPAPRRMPASISAARPTTYAGASTTSTRCARSGHEIASHAVGHFNGSGWSAAEWATGVSRLQRSGGEGRSQQRFWRCGEACVSAHRHRGASARPISPRAQACSRRCATWASATTPAASAMRRPGRRRSTASGASIS